MTLHLHPEFVEGCYRCDLSRDEVSSPMSAYDQAIIFNLGSAEVARRSGLADVAAACDRKAEAVLAMKRAAEAR